MPRSRDRIFCMGSTLSTLIIILMCAGLWQLATAGWIQGKAFIAQQLFNHSWNQVQMDPETSTLSDSIHRPWPWADTWPVAKMIIPEHDIEQIILAGDSGSSLAFGPGYSLASAAPNTAGKTVISAHRDTHFQFLKDIRINDTINLQTRNTTISYRVYDLQVVDSKTHVLQDDTDDMILVLATCYPFNALSSGGSLRYLVYAASPASHIKAML